MTVFRVGQRVACIEQDATGTWFDEAGIEPPIVGPKFLDVCIISKIYTNPSGLDLIGYPAGANYLANNFRPLTLTPQSLQYDIEQFEDIAKFAKVDEAMRQLDTIGDKP